MNSPKPRAQRAVDAAVSLATSFNIHVEQPQIIADLYGIRVYLAPAPIVARVSTLTAILRQPIQDWLSREIKIATYLNKAGAPVVAPSDLLPPGPHLESGFAVSFWQYVKPISSECVSDSVFRSMLRELHQAMVSYPEELPTLAPIFNDIPSGIARLEALGDIISRADLAFLKETWQQVQQSLMALSSPVQPLHGDAHSGNIIAAKDGLLWNDFEDVCSGPIEWDWSCSSIDILDQSDVYPERLEFFRYVRLLQAAVWGHALLKETPLYSTQIRELLGHLKEKKLTLI